MLPKRFVYVIRSEATGRTYIGLTSDFAKRLAAHNAIGNVSNAKFKPWCRVTLIEFQTEARFERYLRSGSGRAVVSTQFGGGKTSIVRRHRGRNRNPAGSRFSSPTPRFRGVSFATRASYTWIGPAAFRMARPTHPVFAHSLPESEPLWRYFDFAKFASLLTSRTLWFSRADHLGDPLEGSFTNALLAQQRALLSSPPSGMDAAHLREVFAHNSRLRSLAPKEVFVNCWHRGQHESMALWRGYGNSYGVAIRSSIKRLDQSIPERIHPEYEVGPYIAPVQYLDYSSEIDAVPGVNVFAAFLCKSVAYHNEQEVRAVFWDVDASAVLPAAVPPPIGHAVPVDINALTETVVVSPLAPSWFFSLVAELAKHHGLAASVTPSAVLVDPVY
jgi:hypothetical protein